ncbi:MAG: prepilin-type N-terminal cleavage/methylation domain-containing protein [Opitutaceae bacterium]|jgi:prepilin-type N-terminal cleavage/methylation domain-containing protein/prepilin-type processing-associated H-X9-DG protein|nr:prepilin-type N-terminal cleavage/methylation domain-containing protein [Opitutaceae bacterium]
MKTPHASRAPRAFTLIELLAVITIIGILVAIIIPVTGKVRESAKSTTCVNNLRQIGIGLNTWATDNKGRLPDFPANPSWWDSYTIWNNPGGNAGWIGIGKLYGDGYITDGRVFYCPTALAGMYDYESQWAPNVRGKDDVTGFRAGYCQRIAPADRPLTLTDGVNHILVTDIFVVNYSQHASARNGAGGARYVNILYMDGHVRCDKTGNRWAHPPANALYENWEQFP